MIRRPPRSTLDRSSAASDVYKRQTKNSEGAEDLVNSKFRTLLFPNDIVAKPDFLVLNFPNTIKYLLASMWLMLISSTSVSYTHLRAHETVLDLVCRLLLEKKKKNKKKNKRIKKKVKKKKRSNSLYTVISPTQSLRRRIYSSFNTCLR